MTLTDSVKVNMIIQTVNTGYPFLWWLNSFYNIFYSYNGRTLIIYDTTSTSPDITVIIVWFTTNRWFFIWISCIYHKLHFILKMVHNMFFYQILINKCSQTDDHVSLVTESNFCRAKSSTSAILKVVFLAATQFFTIAHIFSIGLNYGW